MVNKATIDRKDQRRRKKDKFFDSTAMKVLGLAFFLVIALWIVFGICAAQDSAFTDQIFDFAKDTTLLFIGAVFSAAGIKAESVNSR